MAKDLPYFKFFCSEWNDGDITLEEYDIQGLFINVCSYYWSNECDVTVDKMYKRFKHNKGDLSYLIDNGLIHQDGNSVRINFLDEQQAERVKTSKRNSASGKASAMAKKLAKAQQKVNEKSTVVEKSLNENPTNKKRKDKKREDKISVDWDKLVIAFNNITKKKSRMVNAKARKQILERLKEGYTKEDLISAITNCYADEFHTQNNHKHLTLEFISRPDKLEAWLSAEKRELTEFEIEAEIKNKMQLVKKKNIAG